MAPRRRSSPPRRQTKTLTGFIKSKLFPSNRPDQGGTLRPNDETDSAYNDLRIDPDQLTGGNPPKDKPLSSELPLPKVRMSGGNNKDDHERRSRRWGTPRRSHPDSRFIEDLDGYGSSSAASVTSPPSTKRQRGSGKGKGKGKLLDQFPFSAKTASSPELVLSPPPPEPPTTTTSEILRAKEETRRQRRSLKESGDWLGVQGADPWTGEMAALTPTDTVSSDTTPASAGRLLAGLVSRRRAAGAEYKRARDVEAAGRDRVRAARELGKLEKIERLKEDARDRLAGASRRWVQRREQWSTIAEPNLSPIAQSIDSRNNVDGNGAPAKAIPNFSRPTNNSRESFGQGEEFIQQPALVRNQSTDTIIHNTLDGPKAIPEERQDPGPSNQSPKGKKHFLWTQHRRLTDPGGLVRDPAAGITSSATDRIQASQEHSRSDHFTDLVIPDSHLHLLSPEPGEGPGTRSNSTGKGTTLSHPQSLAHGETEEHEQSKPHDTNATTATSSQSTSKGPTKPRSILRKPVQSQSGPANPDMVKTKQVPQMPSLSPNLQPSHNHEDVPGEMDLAAPRGEQRQAVASPMNEIIKDRVEIKQAPADTLSPHNADRKENRHCHSLPSEDMGGTPQHTMNRHESNVPGQKSVSTPIITITGCDRGQQSRRCSSPPPWALPAFQADATEDRSDDPATPTSSPLPPTERNNSFQADSVVTTTDDEEAATEQREYQTSLVPRPSSPQSPPRKDSPSSAPGPETQKTDTTSTRTANSEGLVSPGTAVTQSTSSPVFTNAAHLLETVILEAVSEVEDHDAVQQKMSGGMPEEMTVTQTVSSPGIANGKVDQREEGKQGGVAITPEAAQERQKLTVGDEWKTDIDTQAETGTDGAMNNARSTLSPDTAHFETLVKPRGHLTSLIREAARTAVPNGRTAQAADTTTNCSHRRGDNHPDSSGPVAVATSRDGSPSPSPQNKHKRVHFRSRARVTAETTPKGDARANSVKSRDNEKRNSSAVSPSEEAEKGLQLVLQRKLEDEIQRQRDEKRRAQMRPDEEQGPRLHQASQKEIPEETDPPRWFPPRIIAPPAPTRVAPRPPARVGGADTDKGTDARSKLLGPPPDTTAPNSRLPEKSSSSVESDFEMNKTTMTATATKAYSTGNYSSSNCSNEDAAAAAAEGANTDPSFALEALEASFLLLLAVADAWWIAARPALDPTSELWHRCRARRITCADLCVLVLACCFCVAVAIVVWGVGVVLR
ncbi:hypothetical protein DL764_000756 [Monosporascus ibericus]|uniref:Uncharacterized protein n=1 Tax=Monosporascus ibericus TaxID=155417 RepID=A0A4Q4TUN3_9PEZI|nr:hypothetical protein DL764_000756 [Monosporascus ibericus]